jgi:hypothetical protein
MFCGEWKKEKWKDHMCVGWFKWLKNKRKLWYIWTVPYVYILGMN